MKFDHNCVDCIRDCKDHSMTGVGMWCPKFISKEEWKLLLKIWALTKTVIKISIGFFLGCLLGWIFWR